MSNYLINKYKGKYRLETFYDIRTNDVPRDMDGTINSSYDDIYIACRNKNMIYHFGRNNLTAYIPSLQRGKRILQELENEDIEVDMVEINDKEVTFNFKADNIEVIATKLGVKTSGANASPFSQKRRKKNKDVSIPTDKMDAYKAILKQCPDGQYLLVHRITKQFLDTKVKRKCKGIDIYAELKLLNLDRQLKEYIYYKDMWDEYLVYLKHKLKEGDGK